MHDLSLHLLDVIENSLAAQATIIDVNITVDPSKDAIRMVVDDNGTGLKTSPEYAVDPFYTTKPQRRIGLGLSLLEFAAAQADGRMVLGSSRKLGGVRVDIRMRLSHIDRPPIGDPAATISSMISAHPEVEFRGFFKDSIRTVDFSTFRDIRLDDPIAASAEAYQLLSAFFKCYAGV